MGSTVGPSVMQTSQPSQPSTSSGVGYGGSRGAYQPNYYNPYSSPIGRHMMGITRGVQSLPQARNPYSTPMNYSLQMPTRQRAAGVDSSAGFRPISTGGAPSSSTVLVNRALGGVFGSKSLTPEQRSANLIKDYRGSNLTEAQYNNMMQNPAMYLDYLQRVEAGQDPTLIGYGSPPPVQYMTAAQQQAYNKNVARQLDSMVRPRTTFNMQNDNSGGA